VSQTDAAAIAGVNGAFTEAFSKGDFATVASFYTEDARLVPPGFPTVVGPEAIGHFWAGGAKTMGIESLTPTTQELDVLGDMAQEMGEYRIGGAQGVLDQGTYVVIWKKGGDGSWRLHWDIWNTDQSPPV
jgi:ketosteroid isomerase-like protein